MRVNDLLKPRNVLIIKPPIWHILSYIILLYNEYSLCIYSTPRNTRNMYAFTTNLHTPPSP